MGRKFPGKENPSIHPVLSLSLLVAYMAAIVALVTSLCASRKKASSPTPSRQSSLEKLDQPKEEAAGAAPPTATATSAPESDKTTEAEAEVEAAAQNEESSRTPLPPPPGLSKLRGTTSFHYGTDSSPAPQKKKLTSMSMRVVSGGLGSLRQFSKREEHPHEKKREKKFKHEDSVWKKTIILGERCRVPDDEDDTIIYDDKGNRISTYHPKSHTPLAASRPVSVDDADSAGSSSVRS